MSNKLLLAASVFAISLSLANAASASCDGPYLAVRGGVTNHSLGDKDENVATDKKLDVDDNAMMFSGAIGYRWGYFRVEAEYVYREDTDDSNIKVTPGIHSVFVTQRSAEFSSESYMANVYWDLSPYTMFTPYISGGLGITRLEYTFKNTGLPNVEYKEDNFTWSVGAGLSAQVTTRFNIDVGYRYYDKKNMDVLFPFGYGLSYTTFEYSNLTLDKSKMNDTDTLTVSVDVRNTGKVKGKEVVQLYVGMPESHTIRPVKELRGFEKIELEPGEEKTVIFTLAKRAFAYYRTDISDWYVESGDYTIMAAKSSRDIACTATVNVTSTTQIKRVYTMNSTIEEIMESPVGREILGKMMAQNPLAQADADDIGMGEAMARMMAEMPLRALLSFGGDSVPAGAGEMLLQQLNA